MRKILIATVLTAALFCHGAKSRIQITAESPQAIAWADSVMNQLTLRQRVAQLMCPKVVPTQGATTRATLKRLCGEYGIGSILFTEGSAKQYAEMLNYAQSLSKVPVLVTMDGEWGVSMRVRKATKFPRNMALGAITDTNLIEAYGRHVADECRTLGIHVNFAPVADVNSNPRNPVIGDRSFGEDPQRVAALTAAYSRGLEAGGVQAVAKHFPGHGNTDGDSHKMLPTIKRPLADFRKVEFVPFKRFIADGGSGVMMAHLSVPSIDKSGTATSLTPKSYALLRNELGFRGLVYTDAMGMKGAVTSDGSNNAVAAIKAGADVVECRRAPEDIQAVMDAIKAGKISEEVINDRCRRILQYKYALGLNNYQPAVVDGALERINTVSADSLNRALCRAMITVVVNKHDILPLGKLAERSIAVVNIGGGADNRFAETCSRYADVDVYAAPDGNISATTLDAIRRHNTIIIGVYNNKATSVQAFNKVKNLPGAVAVFFTTPYRAAKFVDSAPGLQAVVMAYEDIPMAGEYAAQALFGGIDVNGKLPADLGKLAKCGTGIALKKNRLGYTSPVMEGFNPAVTDSLDRIINDAIETGAFPGAQLLVARHGNVVHNKSYGNLTAGGTPVNNATLYDLASVSKALGTLPGVMLAVDRGLIDVDSCASKYIAGLRGTGKDSITVREMLYHETGIPPALNMFDIMVDTSSYTGKLIVGKADKLHPIKIQKGAYGHRDGRLRTDIVSAVKDDAHPWQAARGLYVGKEAYDTIMGRIYNIPLRPTKRYAYSCLNFCLLMDAEQQATGQTHTQWCRENIWALLGATSIGYRPYERFDLGRIAPTENDTYLRRQTVHGTVHDETAAFSGGEQGNAGLFANANDLAKICQMWLNGGVYGDARILSPETVELFTTSKSPTCRRGLGFDKPDTENPENSPTCDEAPADTYGHLGFTGTIFWVVPSQDLIFIFLNNRVNPTRDNAAFNRANVRPELFRQVLNAL